jgi:protein TonB
MNNLKTDFLDILFDGRNKDYGAYDLRRSEDRRVRNAIIGTASFALVIIGGYVLSNNLMAADMATRKDVVKDSIVIRDLDIPIKELPVTPPPTPPSTPPPPASSSIRVATPVITDDELVRAEDEMPKLDSIGNKSIGLANTIGDPNGVDNSPFGEQGGVGPVVEPPKVVARDEVFSFVEFMPTYPGGEDALAKFLRKNMRYPNMAQENGIEGKVFVQFVVDYEGKISEVQTVGARKGGGLEEEAMRVVKMMPSWKPGRQNGQAVSVRFNIPIGFYLQH